jgi:hypothetical protein
MTPNARDFGTFSFEDYQDELEQARKQDNAKSDEQVYREWKASYEGNHGKIVKNLREQMSLVEKEKEGLPKSHGLLLG